MSPIEAKKLSELHGKKLTRPLGTVYDNLTNPARKYGSKTAIVCMHQAAELYSSISKAKPTAEYLRWNFTEITRVSHVMAIALAEGGVRPGMTIAAFVENNIESQILFRASLELNCPISLLNPKSTSNHRELLHLFEILQPSVILVPNLSIAKILDEVVPQATGATLVKLVCASTDISRHWHNFGAFLESGSGSDKTLDTLNIERKPEDIVVILFTSGTTSLPKGVPHTNNSLSSIFLSNAEAFELTEDHISCSHSPFFHMFGLVFTAFLNIRGCTIVLPSPGFDAKATLRAIEIEGANIFPLVPAISSALLTHQDFKRTDISAIDHIVVGTASVTPEYMKALAIQFGANRTSDGYGLTETGAIWFHSPGNDPKDTYPCPELMVRVCDPVTDEVLPRGEFGELHCGGTGVVTKYLLSRGQGEAPNEAFYHDSFGHWLRTGDQVVMAENGEIKVIGRYKDLIKRGGENLSPSMIELVLSEEFGLVAEVVGVPDEVAGEVPVAIVKGKAAQKHSLSDVRGKLIEKLGPLFALEDVITVEQIGLEDFPKTFSGKTQKNILREKTIQYLQTKSSDEESGGYNMDTIQIETMTALWSKHLGVNSLSLHPQKSIHDFADSLTLTRFSAVLRKATGHSLSLQELLDNPTIEEQVQVLSSRKNRRVDIDYSKILPKHAGPPTSDDMAHAMGDEAVLERTKSLSEEVLSPLGLSWNDVEDVIPMQPTLKRFLEKRRPQSNNHRHTWICKGRTTKELEEALKKALTHHSILRAMTIQYDSKTPMHLTIRPSQTFFSHSFTHMPPVKNAQELWKQCFNDKKLDWAAEPGPLFRATFSHVEEENCAGLVYMIQHSNFDAISYEMFLEDLDTLLVNPKATLIPRPPYKAWADSFYNLRSSAAAQRSIAWQANRLKGISNHKKSLFPEQRAPEWFKGQSNGWVLSNGELGPPRKPLDGGASDGAFGTAQRVKLHDAKILKSKHGVDVPQIARAALAIMNTRRTKSSVALFGQYQAGRTWAFLPKWQSRALPDAMNLNGPTTQSTAVIVKVNSSDSLAQMLAILQEEQEGLNTHAHAPYDQLVDRLNDGGDKDGDTVVEIIRRQIFNWLPGGAAAEHKSLQLVQIVSRADVGILWLCTMPDEDTLQVHISWDDAQLSGQEATELLEDFLKIAEQVSKKENWEKTIGELS